MTVKKRGLGRGLEALLVDVSAKEDLHQPQAMQSVDGQPVKDVGQDASQPPVTVAIDDCMDAGGTTPGKGEVESRQEQRSRAPTVGALGDAGAVADEVDDRAAMVVALFKNIQIEHLVLLEEAEALRKLIEEFEAIIRADLA